MNSSRTLGSASLLVLLSLNVLVWGYVLWGSSAWLGGPKGSGLPMPQRVLNDLGSPTVQVDGELWELACEQTGLPLFPDPNGLEYEPIRRLVEASQRWARSGDGDELGRMGQIALALELYEPAIDCFAAAHALGSDKETWTYFLGVACQQMGDSQNALEALEAARQQNPDYGTTSTRIGALYFDLADFEQADANYQRATQAPPAPAAGWVGRGRVAVARRDFSAALTYLDEALRTTPRDFLAHRLRSQALAGLGRLDEAAQAAQISNALPSYRGWLTFDPRLGEAYALASTQRHLEQALSSALARGDLSSAAATGEQLLERLPNSVQILSVVSRILANSGNLPRALELSQRAVQLEPENLQALSSLADIAVSADRLEVAAEAAQAMLSLAPDQGRARQVLGRLYFKQGKVEEALAELRLAITAEPGAARPRMMLVDVLMRSERWQEAEQELEELLARDPSHAPAQQTLQALRAR